VRLRDTLLSLRASGKRFTPVPVQQRDEIGELTDAFNGLMSERDRLQQEVEARPGAGAGTRPRRGGQPRQERFRGQHEP
jgi:hypothetical protein